MIGDPYTIGCQKSIECRINDDCPKSAKCINEKGVPKCRDVCEGVECGLNSECRAENHAGFCVCRNGYDGNPKDRVNGCKPIPKPCQKNTDCSDGLYCNGIVCQPPCNSDNECQSNEVCASGQCKNPCDIESMQCGMNAICSTINHQKSKLHNFEN
jgi:hypothetical protein